MNQHKDSNNINKSDYSKVLDTEEGIARLVNNELAYLKILRNFKSEYKNVYKELGGFLEDKDYDNFNMKIHSLKGSTGNISANKIYHSLLIINNISSDCDYDQIYILLDDFKRDLNELFAAIDYYLELNESE
jgi:HPt (histidine-containing phosphotransfer) domain-containing protein